MLSMMHDTATIQASNDARMNFTCDIPHDSCGSRDMQGGGSPKRHPR